MPADALSPAQYAARCGVSTRTVAAWKDRGMPVLGRARAWSVDPAEADRWRAETLGGERGGKRAGAGRPKGRKSPRSAPVPAAEAELLAAVRGGTVSAAAVTRALSGVKAALRLLRLRHQAGELIDAGDAGEEWARALSRLGSTLAESPPRVYAALIAEGFDAETCARARRSAEQRCAEAVEAIVREAERGQ